MNLPSGKFESVNWAGFCSDIISWITHLYCMAGCISTVLSPPHCIKDYLRSTMTQAHLNHLMVAHVHKDGTENLNIVDIAKAFVSLNDRQSAFFGHFK